MLAPIGRPKTIHWSVRSKKDPRWNKSGSCLGLILMRPHEVNDWIKKCRKKYGKQPKDLTYEAYKD